MPFGALTNTSSLTWCYFALANFLTHRKALKSWNCVSTDLGSFLYALYWAVRFLVGSCVPCHPARKTSLLPSLQFPWGYRLTISWSRGKVKGKGVPRVFLLSFEFCIRDWCSDIQRNHHLGYVWSGLEPQAPSSVVFSEKGYADDRGMVCAGKVSFGTYCFPN